MKDCYLILFNLQSIGDINMNIFAICLCLILFINQEFINLLYFSQSYHNHTRTQPTITLGHNT